MAFNTKPKENKKPALSGGGGGFQTSNESDKVITVVGNKTYTIRTFDWQNERGNGSTINIAEMYENKQGEMKNCLIKDEHGRNKQIKSSSVPILRDDDEFDELLRTLNNERLRHLGREDEIQGADDER